MERLIKIGDIKGKNSKDIRFSKMGIGFEKLDRDAFDPSKCYDMIANLGVKWVRIQSGWAKTETQKGVYDFGWLDTIVDSLIEIGMKPWICLCYGNGLYSKLAAKVYGAVGVAPVNNPEAEKAWENYVKATVEHYKSRVDTFEIWNEPDGEWCWKKEDENGNWIKTVSASEYGAFCGATAGYIKEVNPDAYVIGGSLCLKSLKYVNEAIEHGMLNNVDGITFHEYTHDESTVAQTVATYRSLCASYGKNVDIIQGESGSQSRSGGNGALKSGAWTQKKQAKQLLRHAIADLAAGVKFTSYFSCMDMRECLTGTVGEPDSYKDYGYFGVLGAEFDEEGKAIGEYTPKLSYRALQVISSLLCEEIQLYDVPIMFHPSVSLRVYGNDLGIESISCQGFKKANGSFAYAYWCPTNIMTTDFESTISFEISYKGDDLRLVDLMDGSIYKLPESVCQKDEFGTYTVSKLPVKDYPMLIMCGDFE